MSDVFYLGIAPSKIGVNWSFCPSGTCIFLPLSPAMGGGGIKFIAEVWKNFESDADASSWWKKPVA